VAQLLANDEILKLKNDLLRPNEGRNWELVISTNERIYGGKAAASFDRDGKKVFLSEPELIVFREQDARKP
jgi:hypothetical protein